MCFSATASFVAGASLVTIGVATMKTSRRRVDRPFAAIPVLFGVQQLIEGVIWLSFRNDLGPLNFIMTYVYSLFAFVLWPIFVPFAMASMEPQKWRKQLLYAVQAVGVTVGAYLLYWHTRSPVVSQIVDRSVVYDNSHFYEIWVLGLYFASTIGSCLLSSRRVANLFGVLAFVSAVAAYWVFSASFVSVWCFFAAILSAMIYFSVRRAAADLVEDRAGA